LRGISAKKVCFPPDFREIVRIFLLGEKKEIWQFFQTPKERGFGSLLRAVK